MTTVETARGPVDTAQLGPTLMHEHVVTRSPGVQENWPHLWDRNAILDIAERKMADLHRRGIRSLVDLTTVDLGRDIDLIAAVARRSQVHIVVATGVWWMPQRYFSAHGVDAVAELFIRDITQGIGDSGVKAAIIKCATDTAGVTPVIDNILRASARAQKATGVPISTHTWAAGRTGEMQQAIFAQEGVDLSRVIIGHSGDSEDLGYLRGLMERGSTIGMDRFGLENFLPTSKRVEVVAQALRRGLRRQDGALARRQLLDATCCRRTPSAGPGRSGTTTTSPTTSCRRCARPASPRSRSTRCSCAIPRAIFEASKKACACGRQRHGAGATRGGRVRRGGAAMDRRQALTLLAALVAAGCAPVTAAHRDAAQRLAEESPSVDLHSHPGMFPSSPHADRGQLERMSQGKLRASLFAAVADGPVIGRRPQGGLYAAREPRPGELLGYTYRSLGDVRARVTAGTLSLIQSPSDLRRARAPGRPGAMLAVEGGDFLEGRIERVAEAYASGVRSIQLTHYRINELGDIQTDPPRYGGLTPFGLDVIREMNRLGHGRRRRASHARRRAGGEGR